MNVDNQLKFSNHIEMQVNKGNKLLGLLIRRSFTYLDKNSVLIMYKTLVIPLIEYVHTIIYPRYEKDKKLFEVVQRRATEIIQGKDKEYPDRLKTLKLPSMQYRMDRGYMIETYKFTHGKYTSN